MHNFLKMYCSIDHVSGQCFMQYIIPQYVYLALYQRAFSIALLNLESEGISYNYYCRSSLGTGEELGFWLYVDSQKLWEVWQLFDQPC